MRKNVIILEDKYPLNKTNINDEIKKKCIPFFSYILFFLFISTLLISILYYIKKIFKYQNNKQFSKNENIFKSNNYENNIEKIIEIDNQFYKKKINLSNISLETVDFNIYEKIKDKIKDLVEL